MVVVAERKIKTGKCCHCKQITNNRVGLKWACDFDHAILFTQADKAKKLLRVRQNERKENREAKIAQKTRRDWIADTQIVFNKYIRTRDALLPCVCCGKFGPDESWKPGGSFDAGHYLSVGSHPELRFNPENCHKQLKSCNAGAGKYARSNFTVNKRYRVGLIKRIGLEDVERLEGPHDPAKFTIDELKEIKAKYSALTRELLKNHAA